MYQISWINWGMYVRVQQMVDLLSAALVKLLHCFKQCDSKAQTHRKQLRFQVLAHCQVYTYLRCIRRTGSANKSEMSSIFPFFFTSECFLHNNQPTWEKKKPRLALCGSALVSENLWCTRWSRAHSITSF